MDTENRDLAYCLPCGTSWVRVPSAASDKPAESREVLALAAQPRGVEGLSGVDESLPAHDLPVAQGPHRGGLHIEARPAPLSGCTTALDRQNLLAEILDPLHVDL